MSDRFVRRGIAQVYDVLAGGLVIGFVRAIYPPSHIRRGRSQVSPSWEAWLAEDRPVTRRSSWGTEHVAAFGTRREAAAALRESRDQAAT